jgi:tripartite-type tricarboxylate transporter receptor subunit TctC
MAEPDGYTLIISGIASHVIAPAFNTNPPYDGLRDFTHIAYLGGPPVGLLVHPSLGLNSYGEFLTFAKGSPSPLDYTSSGMHEPTSACRARQLDGWCLDRRQ